MKEPKWCPALPHPVPLPPSLCWERLNPQPEAKVRGGEAVGGRAGREEECARKTRKEAWPA